MADTAAIAREMLDKVNQRDIDGFRDLLHPDYTYCGADGVEHAGVEIGVGVVETFIAAFPDLELHLRHQYTEGDVSFIEATATGTHQAELEGIPATGKFVTMTLANAITVKDGKVVGEREYYDQLSLMQQLGVIPAE
jgi:steroid delta-isomerase-like uncharacterized protein